MLFSRNKSINIVYPNGNYPFVYAHHEKKLDSCHERSSSRSFPTKRRLKCFFPKTNASISCIPMGSTHFSMPIAYKNLILSTNEVHPVDSQQNEGLKWLFSETKTSISCIPIRTTHLSRPVRKIN